MKELIEQLKENNIQLEERLLTVNKLIDTISKSNKTNTTNMTVKEYKTAINSLVKEILTNEEIISDSQYFYKDDYFKLSIAILSDIYLIYSSCKAILAFLLLEYFCNKYNELG